MNYAYGVRGRIRRALELHSLDQRQEAIAAIAREVGASLASSWEVSSNDGKFREDEVIRRIYEATREARDSQLWLIAVTSAAASVLSAAAALIAVG